MIRVVLATRNAGKLRDLQHLLGGTFAVLPVPDGVPEVEETGATFVANAVLKARAVSAATGLPAFGDDSGLEVDALGGEPGVYSARYAGAGAGDAANNAKLLARLAGVPPDRRAARFRSAVAFADAAGRLGGDVLLGEGACAGTVLDAPRGAGGFGYDPLFYSHELRKTFAEASLEEKGRVSHRARALAALVPQVRAYFGVAGPAETG
ncbi:MAG TPA: RdgB/HAM1 family non-canonical purine NTP pyrophosphatase [Haliangiales bacterium]|nr:RdgB/HAM1 family non-canonical purine NTP pyrophosphatase [Haliangiales bacterium]